MASTDMGIRSSKMIYRVFWKYTVAKTRLTSWLWIALAIASVVTAANMFRYEVIGGGGFELYDRWKHRLCYAHQSAAVQSSSTLPKQYNLVEEFDKANPPGVISPPTLGLECTWLDYKDLQQ